MNPFSKVPTLSFLLRILLPALLVFCLGLVITGSGLIPRPKSAPLADLPVLQRSVIQYQELYEALVYPPQVCAENPSGESELNRLQKKQCEDFKERLYISVAIGLIPLLFAFVFVVLCWDQLHQTYRRAGKAIELGRPEQLGKVTDPARAGGDIFAWIFCLRVISVAVAGGKQIHVYQSLGAPMPRPGDQLAVYGLGTRWGAPRRVGVFYAPHVAVLKS